MSQPNTPLPSADLAQIESETARYRNGDLNRRDFLLRLAAVTGSMAAAHLFIEKTGLAQTLSTREAAEAKVAAGDVTYPSGQADMEGKPITTGGYLVRPTGEGVHPAVLVIHENRGLNEHTRDVARRFAAAGFVALAPDGLARLGGTGKFATPDEARAAIGTLKPEQALADLEAGLAYLDGLPNVRKGHLASVGFCWGGARSFALATQSERLKAAVVFYGSAPAEAQLQQLKVPVLGLYGELDTRITSAVPAVAQTLKTAGKTFEYKIFPGANHAFFNDTGERYSAPAAAEAWTLTLQFLRAKLA